MPRFAANIVRTVTRIAGDYFAPYYVRCDLGTYQAAWTLKAAEAWLSYCGPRAIITARYYGDEVIVRRVTGAAPAILTIHARA